MNNKILIELNCFPSSCYFSLLKSFDQVVFEVNESYQKQTYRNRFDILTSTGIETLNIPIKKYSNNTLSSKIEIDYSQQWVQKLLKTLETNYASSPFYEHYIDDLRSVILKETKFLNDFNLEVILLMMKMLDINSKSSVTNSFELQLIDMADVRDITVGKRKNISDWNCDNKTYWQVFGNKFVSNLSVLDLIFCEGPMSPNYI